MTQSTIPAHATTRIKQPLVVRRKYYLHSKPGASHQASDDTPLGLRNTLPTRNDGPGRNEQQVTSNKQPVGAQRKSLLKQGQPATSNTIRVPNGLPFSVVIARGRPMTQLPKQPPEGPNNLQLKHSPEAISRHTQRVTIKTVPIS